MQMSVGSVYQARQVVQRSLPATPLLHSLSLSRRLGCEVYVKGEHLSPIRSFKARGAIYCLSRLPSGRSGVACASTGNHGQGMAYAARLFGRRAVVVVPEQTTEQKQAAMRALGADLRVGGRDLAEATLLAQQAAAAEDLVYVEDGENEDVLLGCATLALEVVEQLPDFDYLFVPVGGGNLIAACSLVVKALRPDATLVGVQSTAAPAVYESWRAQRVVHDRCETFAGGVATSYPCSLAFGLIQAGVDDMVLVSDDALIEAALTMLAETGHLPEGAGAAGLAALLANPERCHGQKVVLVLSGGNFEPVIWRRLRGQSQP
jgi:threonine dehydratase